jgi:hypothetical protein
MQLALLLNKDMERPYMPQQFASKCFRLALHRQYCLGYFRKQIAEHKQKSRRSIPRKFGVKLLLSAFFTKPILGSSVTAASSIVRKVHHPLNSIFICKHSKV